MKRLIALLFVCITAQYSFANESMNQSDQVPKIQVALLLDVSNSMDGLINQARAQLWKIVNELAQMQKQGQQAEMELALYTFGDDRLLAADGFVKQWNAFSKDLDLISQNLFALTTSGGEEYCGWTIEEAVDELNWTTKASDLKIIVIAGNESFAQGTKDYVRSCEQALQKNIIINTIYCGSCPDGRSLSWEDGAIRGQGKYMCIDQNETVEFIPTPYDSLINIQNQKLNNTYFGYGSRGKKRKAMQLEQDEAADAFSAQNMTERALSKSSHVYSNTSWDILDFYLDDTEEVLKLKDAELPEILKGKTKKEKVEILEDLKTEREEIKKEIGSLSQSRTLFLANYRAENTLKDNSLDVVMIDLIRSQAKEKGFTSQ